MFQEFLLVTPFLSPAEYDTLDKDRKSTSFISGSIYRIYTAIEGQIVQIIILFAASFMTLKQSSMLELSGNKASG